MTSLEELRLQALATVQKLCPEWRPGHIQDPGTVLFELLLWLQQQALTANQQELEDQWPQLLRQFGPQPLLARPQSLDVQAHLKDGQPHLNIGPGLIVEAGVNKRIFEFLGRSVLSDNACLQAIAVEAGQARSLTGPALKPLPAKEVIIRDPRLALLARGFELEFTGLGETRSWYLHGPQAGTEHVPLSHKERMESLRLSQSQPVRELPVTTDWSLRSLYQGPLPSPPSLRWCLRQHLDCVEQTATTRVFRLPDCPQSAHVNWRAHLRLKQGLSPSQSRHITWQIGDGHSWTELGRVGVIQSQFENSKPLAFEDQTQALTHSGLLTWSSAPAAYLRVLFDSARAPAAAILKQELQQLDWQFQIPDFDIELTAQELASHSVASLEITQSEPRELRDGWYFGFDKPLHEHPVNLHLKLRRAAACQRWQWQSWSEGQWWPVIFEAGCDPQSEAASLQGPGSVLLRAQSSEPTALFEPLLDDAYVWLRAVPEQDGLPMPQLDRVLSNVLTLTEGQASHQVLTESSRGLPDESLSVTQLESWLQPLHLEVVQGQQRERWLLVDAFHQGTENKNRAVLDTLTQSVRFGDGQDARVLPVGARVELHGRVSETRESVPAYSVQSFRGSDNLAAVNNPFSSASGPRLEGLSDWLRRRNALSHSQQRCVSADDYRAHALAAAPDLKTVLVDSSQPACVRLYCVPRVGEVIHGQSLVKVRRALESKRMIGLRLEVLPVEWRDFIVEAHIGPEQGPEQGPESDSSTAWRARLEQWNQRLRQCSPKALLSVDSFMDSQDPSWRLIDAATGQTSAAFPLRTGQFPRIVDWRISRRSS